MKSLAIMLGTMLLAGAATETWRLPPDTIGFAPSSNRRFIT